MAFGNITANAVIFEPRTLGVYQKTGLTFSAPTDEFRIRPSLAKGKDGKVRAAVSRVIEKDITTVSGTIRDQLVITFNVTTSSNFSATEIDSALADINAFVTPAVLDRILSGDS